MYEIVQHDPKATCMLVFARYVLFVQSKLNSEHFKACDTDMVKGFVDKTTSVVVTVLVRVRLSYQGVVGSSPIRVEVQLPRGCGFES